MALLVTDPCHARITSTATRFPKSLIGRWWAAIGPIDAFRDRPQVTGRITPGPYQRCSAMSNWGTREGGMPVGFDRVVRSLPPARDRRKPQAMGSQGPPREQATTKGPKRSLQNGASGASDDAYPSLE